MSERTAVHRLSRAEARRIAVRAQLLDTDRPDDMVEVVRHLTLLQADPTAAVAPNAELILWSRLGSRFDRSDLQDALTDGTLVEFQGMLRPAEDIALFRAEMDRWHDSEGLDEWQETQQHWAQANDGCRQDIVEKLTEEGALPVSALPDTTVLPWRSSGWNNDRNVRMLVNVMELRGELAAAGRDGRETLWDLAERIYPEESAVPLEEALRTQKERRLHALGIARAKAPVTPGEPNDVGTEAGEPAVIDGVRGQWRIDPAYLGGSFRGRAAILSPLDRLLFDRKRMDELYEFDYQLEMYKPAAKRRWGYWAMPILYGDRLVGKIDAKSDRDVGVFRVEAIHEDEPFTATMIKKIGAEIDDLAQWLDLDLDLPSSWMTTSARSTPSTRRARNRA